MGAVTDRIEKQVFLAAPRERVWRAVADVREFERWFGIAFDGPFVAGARMTGTLVPTTVSPEVAGMQQAYAGLRFEIAVERVEPPRLLAFRWHPGAVEAGVDYSKEPMTLVEFLLEDAPGGTRLTMRESGFDRIPLGRRAKAFEGNEGGWEIQTQLVARYLALHPGA